MVFSAFKKNKIEVFIRHCFYSKASAHKERPDGFSFQKCYHNFFDVTPTKEVNCTFFLDISYQDGEKHFIQKQSKYPVIEMSAGCEAQSFLALLDHIVERDLPEETIIYLLEDDYLHREGWTDILREGLSLPEVDYVTLFDQRDKYGSTYKDLTAKIFHTESCHWRTTPSTTNTYATKLKTLKRDLEIHRAFSIDRQVSADHDKFCKLRESGATLISSIPGFATHVEPEHLSPCHPWEDIFFARR